jgi:hypothetical protein
MKTRVDAIHYLRSFGYHARARDWALGESIIFASEVTCDPATGIELLARPACCIVRSENGWTSFEFDHPRPDDHDDMSLEDACRRALRIIEYGSAS